MAERVTSKMLPAFLLDDPHIMLHVMIEEDPGKTVVTIVATGADAPRLADVLTAPEEIALSFSGIPVQNNLKEKH